MLFNICPCCTVSGGKYDLYMSSIHNGDVAAEFPNIFVRDAAHIIPVTPDFFNGNSHYLSYFAELGNGGINITSESDKGDYEFFINSGLFSPDFGNENRDQINYFPIDTAGFGLNNYVTIAQNLTNKELCWIVRPFIKSYDADNSFQLYDVLSGQSFSGGSFHLGTGVSVTGNKIVLQTNDNTSGAWVEFPMTGTGFLDNISLTINQSYDKNILVTAKSSGSFPYGGYHIWINNNDPLSNGTHSTIKYISDTGLISGVQNAPTIGAMPLVINSGSNTGTFTNYTIDFQFDGLHGAGLVSTGVPIYSGIRITLVDNISGFAIDDISGFFLDFYSLKFGFGKRILETVNVFDEELDDFVDKDFVNPYPHLYNDISLFDVKNKQLLWRHVPSTGLAFSHSFSGTDFGKIYNLTGTGGGVYSSNNHFIESDFTSVLGSSGTDDNSRFITINTIVANTFDVLGNNFYGFGDIFPGDSSFGISGFSRQAANFQSHQILMNSTGNKIVFTHIIGGVDDSYFNPVTPLNLGPISTDLTLFYNTILEYDSGGNPNFIYGMNRFDDLEFQLTSSALQFYGQINYKTTHNINELDYDLLNNGIDVPKIQKFVTRDYPNCFSVKTPRPYYNYYTKTVDAFRSITQETKLLFGPYQTGNYTITRYANDFNPNFNMTSYTYDGNHTGAVPNSTGYIVTVTGQFIHGNESTSTLFWSDTLTQNRTGVMVIPAIHDPFLSTETGIYGFAKLPQVAIRVIEGTSNQGIPAAIFTHTRSYFNNTFDANPSSGDAWFKVKIGDNIVLDKKIYNISNLDIRTSDRDFRPANGLISLNGTESSQIGTFTGTGNGIAAFAWFETMFSGVISIANTGMPPITGYRLHVTNSSGIDLWSKDTSMFQMNNGGTDWQFRTKPEVMCSSDRFIYVNSFPMVYPDVWNGLGFASAGSTGLMRDDDGNIIRNGASGDTFTVQVEFTTDECSGIGEHWAFSHNGLSQMPMGYYIPFQVFDSYFDFPDTGSPGEEHTFLAYNALIFITNNIYKPAVNLFGEDTISLGALAHPQGYTSIDCIKNSNLIPFTPLYEDFLIDFARVAATTPMLSPTDGSTAIASGIYGSGFF